MPSRFPAGTSVEQFRPFQFDPFTHPAFDNPDRVVVGFVGAGAAARAFVRFVHLPGDRLVLVFVIPRQEFGVGDSSGDAVVEFRPEPLILTEPGKIKDRPAGFSFKWKQARNTRAASPSSHPSHSSVASDTVNTGSVSDAAMRAGGNVSGFQSASALG